MVGYQGPGSSPARVTRRGSELVLQTRWNTTKPQGMAGTSAHACAIPVMSAWQMGVATEKPFGSYGTHVSNRTNGRPEGRGGGAG
jgi:hypothetical protein